MIDIRGTGAAISSRVNDCSERSTIDSCVGLSPLTWNRLPNASNVQNRWNLFDRRFYTIFCRKFSAKLTKKQNFWKQFYQEFRFFIDVTPPVLPASGELTVQGRSWPVLPTRSSLALAVRCQCNERASAKRSNNNNNNNNRDAYYSVFVLRTYPARPS